MVWLDSYWGNPNTMCGKLVKVILNFSMLWNYCHQNLGFWEVPRRPNSYMPIWVWKKWCADPSSNCLVLISLLEFVLVEPVYLKYWLSICNSNECDTQTKRVWVIIPCFGVYGWDFWVEGGGEWWRYRFMISAFIIMLGLWFWYTKYLI